MKAIELPFDEPSGSTTAQDYSGNGHTATLYRDIITSGRQGNSLFTLQAGFTTVEENPIDFGGNFTLYFWVLTTSQVGHAYPMVFYLTFAGLTDQYLRMATNSIAITWTMIAIVKDGQTLTVYRSGTDINTFTATDVFNIPGGYGAMTNLMVATETQGALAFSDQEGTFIDNFTVHNGEVFTAQDFKNLIINQTTKLAYTINGIDLKDLRIFVEDARGLVGRPAMKAAKRYDWPDRHGIGVDLKNVRFEARKIELDCWFKAATKDDAIEKAVIIKQMMSGNGLQRFMFQAGSRYLPYEVYFPEEYDFEIPLWVDGGGLSARFTMVMIEPQPVKRVLKFVRTSSGQSTVNIAMTTNRELFSVYWGDGAVTHNVVGQAASIQHTYDTNGEYYIIVAGTIERLTAFTTNAVVVWPRSF